MPNATRRPLPHRLAARAGRVLAFLWSGWAGVAALCLLAAAWQAGHEAYGPFILTSPLDTVAAGDDQASMMPRLTSRPWA